MAQEAAKQAKAHFLPLEDLIIGEYEELGKDYVDRIFFDPKDGTHTLLEGAKLNSSLITNYFYENPEIGLKQYLH